MLLYSNYFQVISHHVLVIITSSSDEKLSRADDLGADHLINHQNYHTTPDWDDEVLRLTGCRGADIILENGGAQTTAKSFNCLRFGGPFKAIGYVSGRIYPPEDRMDINLEAIRKSLTLKGMLNSPMGRFEEMLHFYEKHHISPIVDRVSNFEDARDALAYLWSGKHFGKIILRVNV